VIELLFCLVGIGLGVFTGLAPGIHVNTVALFLVSLAGLFDPAQLAVVIIAVAVTHTFFDFVPSILLGAPDPETSLSVLPGHRMLLEGRATEAVYLTLVGGLVSVVATLLLLPLFLFAMPLFYGAVQGWIHVVLLLLLAAMVLGAKDCRAKGFALLCFFLSGTLGLVTVNTPLISRGAILFPVFTGLFGVSTLLLSFGSTAKIPPQKRRIRDVPLGMALSGSLKGIISGMVVGTLPAVGASEATTLSHQLSRISRKSETSEREFLVSLGAVNTIVAVFSLISLYTISKARSGAAVAVQRLLPSFQMPELLVLVAVVLASAGISALLLLKSMHRMVDLMQRVDYRKATIGIIASLVMLVAWFTGAFGLLVLITSTAIGALPPLLGVKRTFSMGVLILPTILFYLA